MHPQQREFFEAFKAWDASGMAASLLRLVEEFGSIYCSEETRNEILWSCREFLDSIEIHPNASGGLKIPEGNFTLVFLALCEWPPNPASGLLQNLKLRLSLSATEPEELQGRWRELGLSREEVVIPRIDVRTPEPLKGEPGYLGYQPEKPSIHRPAKFAPSAESDSYAYALSARGVGRHNWLDRYIAGDCEAVWTEMGALGEHIREESFLADAVAVCRETMRRCRINVEEIVSRLRSMKYEFVHLDDEQAPHDPFQDPHVLVLDQIADVERRVGALPLSLCAWYEMVGEVDLIGRFVDWPEAEGLANADPLVVQPSEYILEYDEDNWVRERYTLQIAPDWLHKENTSGGPPYTIRIPCNAADVPLEYEWHETTFVNYLRECFKWGGFPGWERVPTRARLPEVVNEFTRGLLQI